VLEGPTRRKDTKIQTPPQSRSSNPTQTPVASLRKPPPSAVTMPWIKRSR
jgi:hypothetical protein